MCHVKSFLEELMCGATYVVPEAHLWPCLKSAVLILPFTSKVVLLPLSRMDKAKKRGFILSYFFLFHLYMALPDLKQKQQIKVTVTLVTDYTSRTLNVLSVKC